MASVRKRKMARSSVRKNTKRVKDKQRNIKMTAHPVMQQHWDNKLTLKQNYKKLGLTVRLNKQAGGEEPEIQDLTQYREEQAAKEAAAEITPQSVASEEDPSKIPEGEARIIRDPETNEAVKVIYGTMKVSQAGSNSEEKFSIVDELTEYNKQHAKAKNVPQLPEMEIAILERLHAKYGEDFEKMRWDKKLNPTFMSAGQLKKKFGLWSH